MDRSRRDGSLLFRSAAFTFSMRLRTGQVGDYPAILVHDAHSSSECAGRRQQRLVHLRCSTLYSHCHALCALGGESCCPF
eukprot:2123693-Amphidinium_carterae.1